MLWLLHVALCHSAFIASENILFSIKFIQTQFVPLGKIYGIERQSLVPSYCNEHAGIRRCTTDKTAFCSAVNKTTLFAFLTLELIHC